MSKEFTVDYPGLPTKEGLLSISAIIEGRELSVVIVGDGEGLRYLAKLLHYMADLDIEKKKMPPGARAHVHLYPGSQLIDQSCYLEICRAEAKGTGELPIHFVHEGDNFHGEGEKMGRH